MCSSSTTRPRASRLSGYLENGGNEKRTYEALQLRDIKRQIVRKPKSPKLLKTRTFVFVFYLFSHIISVSGAEIVLDDSINAKHIKSLIFNQITMYQLFLFFAGVAGIASIILNATLYFAIGLAIALVAYIAISALLTLDKGE